jgi:hypothetical protein
MMNIEVMKVLVAERRSDLSHTARAGRLARSLRRTRRHHGERPSTAAA